MSRLLGAAILGTGDVSGEHIKAFTRDPRTEVRAILSRDRARAAAKAAACGLTGCRAYDDLDELLRSPDIDIVSICTPHHLHAAQGVACASSGRHLVVEKPIALSLDELRRLDRAVRERGVRTVVSFVLRWNPLFENIRAILAQGLVGELYHAEVDYLHGLRKAHQTEPWMKKRQMGGSAVLTGGCHAVDALRWFVGREATEVFAFANRTPANAFGFEYEPNSVALVRFAGGVMGKVATSLEHVGPYTFPIALLGDRGAIRDNRLFTAAWPGQNGWAEIPSILPDSPAVTHHPFDREIAHLVDCIETGVESHCSVADAVRTHEICLAADLSAREGRPVQLPLAR